MSTNTSMILYPAIDLRKGRCVRLSQGRFDAETVYGADPVAVAKEFAAVGATWLHVVDLDGALDSARRQLSLVSDIIQGSGLRVQSGGGIRDAAGVEGLLAAGAERVIVGSLCVKDPSLVRGWIERFGPERIVPALDVRVDVKGVARIAIAGWQEDSAHVLEDVIKDFLPAGLRHVLCTDISRDGLLQGPNFAIYESLKQRFPTLQVQASGGVASLEDLKKLKALGSAGAIVGRALYERKFTLKEALAC